MKCLRTSLNNIAATARNMAQIRNIMAETGCNNRFGSSDDSTPCRDGARCRGNGRVSYPLGALQRRNCEFGKDSRFTGRFSAACPFHKLERCFRHQVLLRRV